MKTVAEPQNLLKIGPLCLKRPFRKITTHIVSRVKLSMILTHTLSPEAAELTVYV
jgi:hypothetical protein